MQNQTLKNILWILLALVVFGVLYYFNSKTDVIPHGTIREDSVKVEVGVGTPYSGGDIPSLNYIPTSPKKIQSEAFIGKTTTQCLEMIAQWDDGLIYDMGDGQGGVHYMDFTTNNHHHFLTFGKGICETDEIITK